MYKNKKGKHRSLEEWLHLIELYENHDNSFIDELMKDRKSQYNIAKKWFLKKYRKYLYNNRDMNVLLSKIGKAPKKGCVNIGRPRKEKDPKKEWEL